MDVIPEIARTKGERRKRYDRDEAEALPLRLTTRDIDIVRHVARHRFLRSDHIERLVGDTSRIPRRLQALFKAGYLDRPKAQLIYYAKAGSERMAYGLGQKGARLLSEIDGSDAGKLNWTHKNREVGQAFVHHTLMVADTMVGFEIAARLAKNIKLIDEQQILSEAPSKTQAMLSPHKVTAKVRYENRDYTLSLVPDTVLALEIGDERINFYLEADRGTMPVIRKARSLGKDNRQTSILGKLLTYYQAWRDGHHKERYGWQNFRVLFVTTSPDRMATMLDAVNEITNGRGSALFLFAHQNEIAGGDLVQHTWLNGKGERVKLGD
jgi:Replication-relaxation